LQKQEQEQKRALNNAITNDVKSSRISIRAFRKEESEWRLFLKGFSVPRTRGARPGLQLL
jgi:hypothetical protein